MAGKILIVDDDRDITQIIQLLLEGEGYDTAVAGSGEEALERLDGTVELVIQIGRASCRERVSSPV